jgi:hypothetical protein
MEGGRAVSLHASGVSLIKLLPWRDTVCSLLGLRCCCRVFAEPEVPPGGSALRMDVWLVAANSPGPEATSAERLALRGVRPFSSKPLCVGATGNEDVRWRSGVGCGDVCHGSIEQCEVSRRDLPTRRLDAGRCCGGVQRALPRYFRRISCSQGGASCVVGE